VLGCWWLKRKIAAKQPDRNHVGEFYNPSNWRGEKPRPQVEAI
jgi:hypothetical protein